MTQQTSGTSADIYHNIPEELKERKQWIVWRLEHVERRPKPTKVPYQMSGRRASSTDPTTWSTFEEAVHTAQTRNAHGKVFMPNDPVTAFNGIGFVFTKDDPFTGIDFDNCVRNGQEIHERVREDLLQLNSYTERSQSGTGLHTIIKGKLPSDKGRKAQKDGYEVETYEWGRFFVMTGNHVHGTPRTVEPRQEELNRWFADNFPPNQPRQQQGQPPQPSGPSPTLTDEQIIQYIFNERNGDYYKNLYFNGYAPDDDFSCVDLGFCNKLAFYTQDPYQIDRIFRSSAIYREKWDSPRGNTTWGMEQIHKAITERTGTFTGPSRPTPAPPMQQVDGGQAEPQPMENWTDELQVNKTGKIYSNAFNILLILNNDANLKGKFAYNMLTHRPEIIGTVPWSRISESKTFTDFDDACLRNYMSIHYGIKARELIFDGLAQICTENKYHPVRRYLKRVYGTWDGKPRLETLLIDYFGADDTELNRWQTKLTFVGAVQRAFEAGSKMDYVLTLKGEQGMGKSSFFQTIAVDPEWFTDSVEDLGGKDAKELIRGKWIIELGEMAAVRKADQKKLKQFITSQVDEFRESYGRRINSYPRQCIFVATTNDELPLKDDTGGRRWWIVEVKKKWFEHETPLEVDQIWAEAMEIYKDMKQNNKAIKLPDHVEAEARKIQSANTDKGLYAGIIEDALEAGYVEYHNEYGGTNRIAINETCAFHVWEVILKRHLNDINKGIAREINAVLKDLDGWENIGRRQFGKYGKQTVYRRIQTDE